MSATPSISTYPQDGRYLTVEAIIQYGKLQGSEVFNRLIREKRNAELKASDWSVYPDSPLSESKKQQWLEYRQALRDVPQNIQNEENVVWPVSPRR